MKFQGYHILKEDKIYSVVHGRHLDIALVDDVLGRIRLDAGKAGIVTIDKDGVELSKSSLGPMYFWHRPALCIPPKEAALAKKLRDAAELIHDIWMK